MHAYTLSDHEAFAMFCRYSVMEIHFRCDCDHMTGFVCEWCRFEKALCERFDLTMEDWVYSKSRAMARRMMRRRRVDLDGLRKIAEAKAAHAALGFGIAPASCIPDHILHKD